MHHAVDQRKRRHKDGEDHVIHGGVVAEIQHTKQLAARNALDAILGISERRLHAQEINHLRQSQGDHRKVDALSTHSQPAREQTNECRGTRS
jgi:hypothetical protein